MQDDTVSAQGPGRKIIAFDTECTVNFFPHIELAVFAYTVSDFSYNIKERRDIYIRAGKPDKRLMQKIQVDLERLKTAPDYRDVYPEIADILLDRDAVILAHGGRSDMEFIAVTNDMRRMKQFRFSIYDTEQIVRNYCEMPAYRLEELCKEWNIPHSPHDAFSDAEACIHLVEHISEEEGISFEEVLERYGGNAVVDSSWVNEDTIYRRRKARYESEMRKLSKEKRTGPMNGKTVCLSDTFIEDNLDAAFSIIRHVIRCGGEYTDSTTKCNIFVHDGNPCSHSLKGVLARRSRGVNILTVDEFLGGKYGRFPAECRRYIMWGAEGCYDRLREISGACLNGMARKRVERLFAQNYEMYHGEKDSDSCLGLAVCMSESFLFEHTDLACRMVLHVIRNGGIYEPDVSLCNLFVRDNNLWSARLDSIYRHPKQSARVITVDQFVDGRYGEFPDDCKHYVLKPSDRYEVCESRKESAAYFAKH